MRCGAGGRDLADEIDVPAFMPSSSDAVATSTSIDRCADAFRIETLFLGQAAVMRGDMLHAELLAQVERCARRGAGY